MNHPELRHISAGAWALAIPFLTSCTPTDPRPYTQAAAVNTQPISEQLGIIDSSTLSAQQKARQLRRRIELDDKLIKSFPGVNQ